MWPPGQSTVTAVVYFLEKTWKTKSHETGHTPYPTTGSLILLGIPQFPCTNLSKAFFPLIFCWSLTTVVEFPEKPGESKQNVHHTPRTAGPTIMYLSTTCSLWS